MLSLLKNWTGTVEIDGKTYQNGLEAFSSVDTSALKQIHIVLSSGASTSVPERLNQSEQTQAQTDAESEGEVRITVKRYMTQKASPEFDFMAKWNNDDPMPLRIMTGRKIKETRGMVYMELHGDMYAEKMCTCMKCGRKLDNPVSQYFGIGPECGNHGYVNPFDSEDELKEAVGEYRKKLQNVTWTGWIIKSAITETENV